jgi:hypothetical protein
MSLLKDEQHSDWLNQLNNLNTIENTIDYFFTQRKVTEFEEILDEKTLERRTKKIIAIHNFLAINFPINYFKHYQLLEIDIEIWGDNKFNYKGKIIREDGEIPHIMIKLKEDKNIFVKLIFKDSKLTKTFISFIPITRRYQCADNLVEE